MPSSSPRIEELKRKFDENPRRYFAPLANEYRKAGDVQEAIRICRAHLPQQPGHMSGHIVFGQALFEAGELDESRQVFEAALQLDPENLIALRHLGDIARARGELTSARHWYERVLDADPRNEDIAAQISSLDAETGLAPAAPADGATGWGDINPEAPAAAAPPAAPSPSRPPVADEDMPTLIMERGAAPSAPASGGRGPARKDADFPELDELGVPVSASSALDAALDSALGRGREAPSRASEPDVGDFPPSKPVAPPPSPPAISASAPNELGLEVMEFVPPARESHAPIAELQTNDAPAPADATPAAFVTETMAELYLQQGFRQEALNVYRQLLAQNPSDDNLRDRVHQLEHGGRSSFSVAEISEEVAEQAQRRHAMPTPSSVRAFFGRLAARRAPHAGGVDAWGDDRQTLAPERPASQIPEPPTSAPEMPAAPSAPAEPSASAPDESRPAYLNDWGGVLAESGPAASRGAAGEQSGDAESTRSAPPDFGGYAPSELTPAQGLPSLDQSLPFLDTGVESDAERGGEAAPDGAPATGGADYDVSAFEIASYEATVQMPRSAPDESAPHGDALAGLGGMELADDAADRPAGAAATSSAPAGGMSSGGTVDALFGGAAVSRDDEAAASTLAGVFGAEGEEGTERESPSGRPTRAANNEISLDHVFRDPTRKPEQRRSSGFSFDQFFSEAVGGTASPTPEAPADGSAPPDASTDIEQFNAWLEGLKKK